MAPHEKTTVARSEDQRDTATPQRADARRNRAMLLETARTTFAEVGATASMNEIARRAGVGMATLYRNFPNRRALLEELYADNVRQLTATAHADVSRPPADALAHFVQRFARHFSDKQNLAAELLAYTDESAPVFATSRQLVFDTVGQLLSAAQDAGEIRLDLTLDELMELVVGILSIPSKDPQRIARILDIALDGLRASAVPRPQRSS